MKKFSRGKNRTIYDNIYSHLIRAVFDLDLSFSAEMIMMDFKLTAVNSARSAFPNISIKGCLFHLNQSLWRKLQELGLSAQYRNPEGIVIRNSIHQFMALTFMPENEIVFVFKAI
jgi:hypothetical protein